MIKWWTLAQEVAVMAEKMVEDGRVAGEDKNDGRRWIAPWTSNKEEK